MALDPDIKKFLDKLHTQHNPSYSSLTPVELRKWHNENFAKKEKPKPIRVASVEEKTVSGPESPIKCRFYYPKGKGPFPALMYFHGGGFVFRDNMDVYDQTCRMICAGVNCVVVSVDFRLAPENPFPAAHEDCYAVTCWVAKHANELNINPNHFGVWGESCGGNLAAAIPLMARDRQGPMLSCQIIVTAMLDNNFKTQSYIENGQGEYFLTEDSMRWFWNHYVSDPADLKNPYCVPCRATDLSNLPKALVIAVEYDPLRDEDKQYAEQLRAAGVETIYKCYSGLIHTFFDLYNISKKANEACKDVIRITKDII